ncbi:F5/8 type C domain protein [compost metagenome]
MLKNVHGFYFWPASTANGNPQNIMIELSSDGVAWQNAGEFVLVNTFVRQNVYLSAAIQARYFKITIKTSTGNTHFTHPTEIGVF